MLRLVIGKTRLDYLKPIIDDVWEVLKKFDLNISKYHQNTFNDYIKIIAGREQYRIVSYNGSKRKVRLKPRYKMFTSHTARRTLGRRWLDNGGT